MIYYRVIDQHLVHFSILVYFGLTLKFLLNINYYDVINKPGLGVNLLHGR